MRFYTEGFLSKWGFEDGDLLDDLLYEELGTVDDFVFDKRDEVGSIYGFDHTVLMLVLITIVLPALDQRVDVMAVGTIHNPLRATKVDGVEVPHEIVYGSVEPPPGMITPEYVDVPDATILTIARSLVVGVE
jgi:hypothetical protein